MIDTTTKKLWFKIIGLIAIVIVMLSLYGINVSTKLKLKAADKELIQYEDVFIGKASIVFNGYPLKSNVKVYLSKEKYTIFPWAENFQLKPLQLSEFIQQGDSINKPSNSDSLFIYREKQKYLFVLKHRIY